jgi:tellurite resistance-related uncharacterized protein
VGAPYRSTPVFDEATLPAGLRGEHRTRDGVWGVVRVLEGRLLLGLLDCGEEAVLTPDEPGLVLPGQPHAVAPLGPMRMRVEFHAAAPRAPQPGGHP